MFSQTNETKSKMQNKEKGQKSLDELWSAKLVISVKGSPGKGRKLRCLTQEKLEQLKGKSAALFVSVDSRDYKSEKLDAMLSALHNVGLSVSLVIVDSNCGLNHVDKDCSNMSDEEFRKEILPLGEKRAQQWVRDCVHIIDRYRVNYPGFVTIRYCSNKNVGDSIGKRIEDEQAYKDAKGIFEQPQNPEALSSEIKQTLEEHFHNKNLDTTQLNNSRIYIEKELPVYYALAKLFNFIVYTSEETSVLRYVRKLAEKNERAKYLQVDFAPISYKDLSLKVVEDKISRGGGIEKDIRLDNFAEVMSQLLMPMSLPSRTSSIPGTNTKNGKFDVGFPLRKSYSDSTLYNRDERGLKKRRASSVGSTGIKKMLFFPDFNDKFSSLMPEQKLKEARDAICQRSDYVAAFELLMSVDMVKISASMKAAYEQLLTFTKIGMDMTLRATVFKIPIGDHVSTCEFSNLSFQI
jgi:hypothetical protein